LPSDSPLFSRSTAAWWAIAVALAVIAMFIAKPPAAFRQATVIPTSYATGVGQRRVVKLEDGSELLLNTASRITVTLDRHTRLVRLISGEVLLNVRHEARPLFVESDGVRILDIGTQFDVYKRESGHLRVSVVKGRIHLTCACNGQINRPTTISANSIDATLGEGDEVAPMRIVPEARVLPLAGAAPVGIRDEEAREPAVELLRDLSQVHEPPRAGGTLDAQGVAVEVVVALERLGEQVVQREPHRAAPG